MVKAPNTTTEKRSEFEQMEELLRQQEEFAKSESSKEMPETADVEGQALLSIDIEADFQEEAQVDFQTESQIAFQAEPQADFKEEAEVNSEMDALMLELELEASAEEEEAENKKEEEELSKNTTTFTLFFSADKMNAYIRAQDYQHGKDADNRVSLDIINELVKEKDVKYGIDEEGIKEYCKGKALYKDFQVAAGKRPIRGIDGSVEYFFSIDLRYAPKERNDGSVDYKELGLVRNVNIGEILCKVTPPTEGEEGIDVLGFAVKAVPGKPAIISAGKGVTVSEDGMQYIASSNGMVEMNKGSVEVKEVYTVQGDVGPATGNIRFNGAVMVMGSVLSDYAVFANGDIIVNGYVEASILNATGNILINNGINGMKKGFLKADGNVTVKFAEMARIVAGANFFCDYCINCDVRAGEAIIGKGKRASFLGGNYIAGRLIDANTIGSELNLAMDMQIIPGWQSIRNLKTRPEERLRENNESISEYTAEINKIKTKYDTLENEIAKLSRRNKFESADEVAEKKKRSVALMQEKFALKHEMTEIEEKRKAIELRNECEGCMVVARKIVHTGVKITIGGAIIRINGHVEKSCFAEEGGNIMTYNTLPGGN